MLLNHNQRLLPKKRDYQIILGTLKTIYGADQRRYPNLSFTNQAFAKLIAQKYPERYGNEQTVKKYFTNFWYTIYQWLNTVNEDDKPFNVQDVRQAIIIFMQYDFDPASNVEYF